MAAGTQIMRALLVMIIIISACTAPNKTEKTEIPVVVVPDYPPVIDTRTQKREPAKPKKVAPKAIEKPADPESEPANPMAECTNIKGINPKETARLKLDCITHRLE